MAGMVIVNNPGDWTTVYWPLLHAEWHGWTPTDLIFPFFLFIMGAAIPFAPAQRRTWPLIARRVSRGSMSRANTVPSAEPETIVCPSRVTATSVTCSVWPGI